MMNGFEYAGVDAILAGSFRAAIYCRLSKDDDLDGESASIANQRDMLETYCEKQGWEVVAVYQDDGYTGLNMERPDLKRMLKAIERRQINLVVTKDLSRLGRISGRFVVVYFSANGQLAAAAKINNRGCALIVMYGTIGLYFSCRAIVHTNGNRFAQLADFTVHVQLAVNHINSAQIRKIVNL